MGRPTWRWGAVAALLAALLALPPLVAALPAPLPTPLPAGADAPADLLARVRASQDVAFSGLGESRGTLALPDVRELAGLPELLGGTTRVRVWWRGETAYRADAVTPLGETDLVVDPAGSWTWDSLERRAVRLDGQPAVRLPRPDDLLAPLLGRRLARTPGLTAAPLPPRRVAGVAAAGLRLLPRSGTPTTVAAVDLWAEPSSGLPLRVEVRVDGQDRPVLVSELLDLALEEPPLVRVAFAPPDDAAVLLAEASDLADRVDRLAPYLLPDGLAGQPRQQPARGLSRGAGLYGEGLGSFAVLPLSEGLGRSVLRRLDPGDDDGRAEVRTPLVNALVVRDGRRVYLLGGAVPPAVLDSAAATLLAERPPRVRG